MKTSLIAFAFVWLMMSSCKKDPPLKNPPAVILHDTVLIRDTIVLPCHPAVPPYRPPWPMIKTISQLDNGTIRTETFEYDSLWRVVRIIYPTFTSTFSYNTSGTTVNGMLLTNGVILSDIYGNNYIYNGHNNCIESRQPHGTAWYFYNADYNMDSSYSYGEAGADHIIWSYTYTYNNYLNSIGNYNTGQYFRGKSNVNLLERDDFSFYLTSNGPDTSGNVQHFNLYNYVYNDSGWVSHRESKQYNIARQYTDSVNYTIDTSISIYIWDYTYY